MKTINGFSKLSKEEKVNWLAANFSGNSENMVKDLKSFWHRNVQLQKTLDEFSENTVSNFFMPFNIAPNFLINGKTYAIPMVIEESSVVAAASQSAKFWLERGGFHAEVLSTVKLGQVHFIWNGDKEKLERFITSIQPALRRNAHPITRNMETRGGGILNIELVDMTASIENYYQLKASFETCDSMGANFINSVLESFAATMKEEALRYREFGENERDIEIVLAILSNYTPGCLVKVWVECDIEELGEFDGCMTAEAFARKFETAVKIAHADVHRATTHNKGIFNGIDAVVMATGNDFRAVEACGHAYASRNGKYESLSAVEIKNGKFVFALEIPLALGTIGGLTTLHPLAKLSLEILGNPSAKELMLIAATAGLANNFAAIKSMVTVGIQKGHMKMHLLNILKQLNATEREIEKAKDHFTCHVVSYPAVRNYLIRLRTPALITADEQYP